MRKLIVYIFISMIIMSCQTKSDVSNWNDEQISDWFNQSEWVKIDMKPDASINKRLFVEQNVLNPKSWEAALKFLKESDFNAMELGRYELSDDGTYVNIEEYTTKDSAHFEAHRNYVDIQYLSKGQEYIHVTPMEPEKQQEIHPYDERKDIEFFDKTEYIPYLLTSANFLVLFPQDGHKPCMKVDTNEVVRKVVVKIPYVNSKIN